MKHSRYFRSPALLTLALATVLFQGGCKKKKAALKGAAGDLTAAVTSLDALKLPSDAIVVGGSASITKLSERIGALAAMVAPPMAMMAQALPKQLQRGLALKSTEPLLLDKPFRFAVFNPEKYKRMPAAFIFESAGKDKVVAAMPSNKLTGDQGNAYSLQGPGGKRYFNFVGDTVVVTGNPTVFVQNKAFLSMLSGAPIDGDMQSYVSVENVYQLYGARMKAEMQKSIGNAKSDTPSAKMARSTISAVQEWFNATFGELRHVVARLSLADKSQAQLNVMLAPKGGSEMSKTFTALSARPIELLSRIPRNTAAAMVGALDIKRAGPQIERFLRWAMTMAEAAGLPKKTFESVYGFWKVMDGQFAMAVHDVADGVAVSGLYGVTDGKAARETMDKMMSIYEDPTYKALMEKTGSKIEIKRDAYKVSGVPVTVAATSMPKAMAKSPAMKQNPAMKMFGDGYSTHFAVSDKLGVYAMGSKAKESIQGFLGGSLKGGLDQLPFVKKALSSAKGKPFLLGFMSAEGVGKQVMSMMGMMPAGATPEPKSAITFTAATKADTLVAAVALPAAELKSIGGIVAPFMSMMQSAKKAP